MRTIDVHAHVIPPVLVEAMRAGDAPDGIRLTAGESTPWVEHRQGYRYPLLDAFHDVEARLAVMDKTGVDLALLSAAPPLFLYWIAADEAVDAARAINDAIVAMARQAPSRFAPVATLPLQRPDAAVAELRRCAALGMVAAQVGPHCEDEPLDSETLRPVLAAAAEAGLPLVIHPYYVGASSGLDEFYLTNLQGNPWQTAVCASRLMFSGTLDELPGLDCVLVHGGGHLPYQIGRLDHGHRVRPEAARPHHRPSDYLRRFHYDTLTHRPAATGWLLDQVGADRVLFGTDTPFDMGGGGLYDQLAGLRLPPETTAAVAHRNAERLFSLDGRR
ncbi:amidohydrolase family protein [Pseudonocardia acaciae]|uniref:amidohydrolase family protein n=1 Tax=Pseudonocardia acaciae TaxID=551276 RepID=UPI0012ED060E|nr:amidohydrolase family protein [Pseudonocardia acaciae]